MGKRPLRVWTPRIERAASVRRKVCSLALRVASSKRVVWNRGPERRVKMPGSDGGTKDNAMRLVAAFHDLAGGKLNIEVSLGGPDSEDDGAVDRAGSEWGTIERDIALRYLLDQGYVEAGESRTGYTLTYQGLEKSREYLGLDSD